RDRRVRRGRSGNGRSKAGAVYRTPQKMARQQRANRDLFPNRRRDRTLPRDHGRRRGGLGVRRRRTASRVLFSAAELFGRFAAYPRRRLRRAERHRAQIDFSELNEGDLVVHLEHGIGRFLGLMKLPVEMETPRSAESESLRPPDRRASETEVLALEFADQAKLYVPIEQAYLVSRYVGVGKRTPPL